jgi:hypothetical protein
MVMPHLKITYTLSYLPANIANVAAMSVSPSGYFIYHPFYIQKLYIRVTLTDIISLYSVN